MPLRKRTDDIWFMEKKGGKRRLTRSEESRERDGIVSDLPRFLKSHRLVSVKEEVPFSDDERPRQLGLPDRVHLLLRLSQKV